MVAETSDVEEVILGRNGYMTGAKRGATIVDMSTISPIATRTIAEKLNAIGVDMLDAPVSGGEIGAINGTLSIMVGGKHGAFERVKPYLNCLGKNIVYVGDHGAGQVAKACNQIIAAATIEGVAEAFMFAKKMNVNPAKVREALLGGFAYSKVLEIHGKRMLGHDFKPGFKAKLHRKDMRIVMNIAHDLGMNLPAAAFAAHQLNALVETGDGELDSSAIFKLVEKENE
jgi:2-hydroxy-3-oxopropionate reductase